MAEFCITCITENEGIVTDIGLGKETTKISVQTAIDDIVNNGNDSYYIIKNGVRMEVYAKKHHLTGRWYLTTHLNDTRENSLVFEVPRMAVA
jgi:hypothetical protein